MQNRSSILVGSISFACQDPHFYPSRRYTSSIRPRHIAIIPITAPHVLSEAFFSRLYINIYPIHKKSVYVHVYALFYILLDVMMFRTEQTVIECILYHFGFAAEAQFSEDACLIGVDGLEAETELVARFRQGVTAY